MILKCIMGSNQVIIFLFLNLLLFLDSSSSFSSSDPLCVDSRVPFSSKAPLAFCSYNGTSCCNTTDDLSIQEKFTVMNVSDQGCASLLKSILCARCDPFSAELFRVSTAPRQVPVLCNSTISANSNESGDGTINFCSKVWNTCENVSITNSPFTSSLQGQAGVSAKSNFSKLIDLWESEANFCKAFSAGSGDGSVCFAGEPIDLTGTETPTPPSGMCLEKIGNGSYLNMVPHPDGSNRAFFSNQQGIIWLASIPKEGSGGTLELDEANPFLDLTDLVHFDTEFGLMGIALHPKFLQNGRLFASFNCDKVKWPGCGGRCSCNSDVNCDPSKIGLDNGAAPCQYQSVIAEFAVNGTAENAKPTEVRRIFTMGLPFTSHHGGQILFGPTDGYLYFMMGDGGGIGDPYNFAQNKKSLLGKIMRLDIDNIPSAADINKLGLWGNYSIPKDNPYTTDTALQPEIWASGFRNPWRCSFDSSRPSYFMCADVGQDIYEEVNMITKGGNYGWRVYEGHYLYTPVKSPGGNTSVKSVNPIFPVMGYNHSDVDLAVGSASITGGYFYRSMTDPCMNRRYLYADLYADAMWAGTEQPINSSNYISSKIPFTCAHDSPLDCTSVPGSSLPAIGYIFSFGEDNDKDIYILASGGVYRIVRASRCNYTCTKENATAATPGSAPSVPAEATLLSGSDMKLVFILLSTLWLFLMSSI